MVIMTNVPAQKFVMDSNLMTVDEVARDLRVSVRKAYQFIQNGELIATSTGTEDRKFLGLPAQTMKRFAVS